MKPWLIVCAVVSMAVPPACAETSAGKRGMLPLGAQAPAFSLPDAVSGSTVSLNDFAGRDALVVMFLCRHCPFVQHVQAGVASLAKDYAARNVGFVAIAANDVAAYPEDAPEGLKQQANTVGFTFPYLYDERQDVAHAYTAVCTPDFFVFDKERKLVYRGRFDDSRPGDGKPLTGQDLRQALNAVLAGTPVPGHQKPSVGCSIKWKPGHDPADAS